MDALIPRKTVGETPELELALFRRSLAELADECERCHRCHRSLLIGERVYEYSNGHLVCELCRDREHAEPDEMRIVHGPAFGHTLRIIDRRPARRAA
jgi:hypothetical protein